MHILSGKNKSEVNDLMPSISMESLFSLPDWHVYHLDSEGKYVNCNEESCHFLELSQDELLYKTNFDFPWKEHAAEWREHDLRVMSSQKSLEFVEVMIHQNNKYTLTAVKSPVYIRNKVSGTLNLIKIDRKTPLANISNDPIVSERELQCLYYLIKGFALKQIAYVLEISPRTVEHHINNAKSKLNCYHRSDLIEKASQLTDIKNKLFLESVNNSRIKS
ncbi:LuxR C-terminal-related transcriptional regulator [Legionella steigerwaltii]|nr:LuxR C-terminal-related transcriptional regulator [Legionella steigerwaltii]